MSGVVILHHACVCVCVGGWVGSLDLGGKGYWSDTGSP